jgi:3-hydroxy-9,10-secoandrosta-1,3,5(10)-triene-9,17-dione monooxygenase
MSRAQNNGGEAGLAMTSGRTGTAGTSREQLLDRARKLVPVLRERAAETNELRRIPEATIRDFWDADLFYLLRPKKFGGPEVRLDDAWAVAAELGRGDGSAAWVWSIITVHDLFVAYFPEETQREFWDRKVLSASSFMPSGKITPDKGGVRLSGKWSFCSGIDSADWMLLCGMAGMLSTNPPIPDIRFVFLPKSDVKVIDDWKVLGLRGTGSKSVTVDDVFIPAHRMVTLKDLSEGTTPGAKIHDSPFYRVPVWALFPFTISSSAVGIARGALECFLDEMKSRSTSYGHEPLNKKPTLQLKVSEASALIDAAELLYRRSLTETVDKALGGVPLTLVHRLRSRRDQGFTVKLLRQAADLLFSAQGGYGLYDNGHVQRAFRDLQALQSHIVGGWDMPALNYGSVALGGTPTDFFF